MSELLTFFIVLLVGVAFPALFSRFHLPWVAALIIGGIVVGPYGLNVFTPDETISFLSEIGLIFLMFMAGLEVNISSLKNSKKNISILTLLNSLIPFLVGGAIGLYFGGTIMSALFMGIIFISTSIAVVVPSLEKNKLFHTDMGKSIVAVTMIEDIISLVLLSFIIQTIQPSTNIPLYIFYIFIGAIIFTMRRLLPIIHDKMTQKKFSLFKKTKEISFQRNLRVVFLLVIGVVVLFSVIGLHPIIAGFFAGLVLSDYVESETLFDKIRIVSYGVFIPIFFIVIGATTNISVFSKAPQAFPIVFAVVLGSIGSKFLSGWLGARISGYSSSESSLIGSSTIPQLSTTLAVVYIGFELGLLSEIMVTSMVILSIITAILGPFLINRLALRIK